MDKKLDQQITQYLENHKEQFIKDLKGLLSIDSVGVGPQGDKPYGEGVADALDYMLALCKDANLTTKNYDYYCGEATYGDGEESVASLTHLDVVPVSDNWKHDPFGAEIKDNVIYARGAVDNKGPGVAALYGLKALLDAGVPLKREIKLIFGCDEESGMGGVKHYLTKTDAPTYAFTPDAEFPVIHAEKNILHGTFHYKVDKPSVVMCIEGGTRGNVVPDLAIARLKATSDLPAAKDIQITTEDSVTTISASGTPAHASIPHEGDNAIVKLMGYLADILPDEDGIKGIAKMAHQGFQDYHGKGLGIDCEDEATGLLTLNLGVIGYDGNMLDMEFDIRQPVTLSMEKLMDDLQHRMEGCKLDIRGAKGLYWPKDHGLVATLMNVYRDVTGDTDCEPLTMGGGTYARALPCAVAFGPNTPNDHMGNVHMDDEYADIDQLYSGARIFAHAFYELANM